MSLEFIQKPISFTPGAGAANVSVNTVLEAPALNPAAYTAVNPKPIKIPVTPSVSTKGLVPTDRLVQTADTFSRTVKPAVDNSLTASVKPTVNNSLAAIVKPAVDNSLAASVKGTAGQSSYTALKNAMTTNMAATVSKTADSNIKLTDKLAGSLKNSTITPDNSKIIAGKTSTLKGNLENVIGKTSTVKANLENVIGKTTVSVRDKVYGAFKKLSKLKVAAAVAGVLVATGAIGYIFAKKRQADTVGQFQKAA